MPPASLLQHALTVMETRSTIRGRRLPWLLAIFLLAPVGIPGSRAASPGWSAGPGSETPDGALWSRLRRIEVAFRDGDAGALRASFCSGKVRVDLPQVEGAPGSYGPGQLQVIFAQIFAAARTERFVFPPAEVTLRSSDTAFARGRWVRLGAESGQAELLTFTLRAEEGDWRIHEILAPR
jgi:hypothetical protein